MISLGTLTRRAAFPRLAAAAAAGCATAGTATVAHALTAAPGLGPRTYVSEAGVPAYPHAGNFRAGILLVAAALILLGAALLRGRRAAGLLLLFSGAATTGAGTVSCSGGCPLPPYEIGTVADLVHATASIVAVAAIVLAMATLGARGPDRLLRGLCVAASTIAFPLSAAVGLAMLLIGRGTAIGLLERALLAVIAAWLLAASLHLTRRPPHPALASEPTTTGPTPPHPRR